MHSTFYGAGKHQEHGWPRTSRRIIVPRPFPCRSMPGSAHVGTSLSATAISAFCQKQTLRRVFDMIDSVGKVLKFVEHHHEISPPTISASGSGRCLYFRIAAFCAGTGLSNPTGA